MKLDSYNILVVDDSNVARNYFKNALTSAGATVTIAHNGKEALDLCLENDFDLILSDIEMPVMDGFEFIKECNARGIRIPRVMITRADIDKFLNLAIENDIGNILSKQVKKEELIKVCHTLITQKGLFGLYNYIPGAESIKRVNIIHSNQINPTIKIICSDAFRAGSDREKKMFLSIILSEVLINAIYHAHGYTEEKKMGKSIRLKEGQKVEICFGRNSNIYGISVTDFQGKLTKQRILRAFKSVVDQETLIEEAAKTGQDISAIITETGRGLQMIRMMANDYYFNIQRDIKTQIIILIDTKNEKQKKYASVKINEVF